MLTVSIILLLAAAVITVVHAMGKSPIWPAVGCLIVVALLQHIPR